MGDGDGKDPVGGCARWGPDAGGPAGGKGGASTCSRPGRPEAKPSIRRLLTPEPGDVSCRQLQRRDRSRGASPPPGTLRAALDAHRARRVPPPASTEDRDGGDAGRCGGRLRGPAPWLCAPAPPPTPFLAGRLSLSQPRRESR